jgi:hypothetical protein
MDASETPHHDPADDDPARSDRNHAHSLPRRPHRPRTALAPAHPLRAPNHPLAHVSGPRRGYYTPMSSRASSL